MKADEEWQDFKEANIDEARIAGYWHPDYDPWCLIDIIRAESSDPIAVIRIPDALSGVDRQICIAQELSHSTGILYDTDELRDTVFSGRWGTTYLTPVDVQLFRIHSDARLRPNMFWDEAQPIVREIIEEMEAPQ